MSCSSIPFMNVNSVNFVQNNLMLDATETQANTHFTQMIRASVESLFPRLNFLVHTVAQKMSGNTSAVNPESGFFSFTNETFTYTTDGKIKFVQVSRFEKWRNPTKVYVSYCI